MKFYFYLFVCNFIFLSCKNNENDRFITVSSINKTSKKEIDSKEITEKTTKIKNTILGVWTDGSTENATIEIKPKSIYYVDDFIDYNYKLENDSIEINYLDYIYRARILLKNDTIIMNSKGYNQIKFWRFKK